MADNRTITDSVTGSIPVATDEIAGVNFQRVKITHGIDGVAVDASAIDPVPITGALAITGTMPITAAVGSQVDGHSASIGSTIDAAATTTGSVIAQLRRIANLIAGTLTVTGAVTNAGTFATQPTQIAATTPTLTNTAASASNVANLVALNTNRLGLHIFNDSASAVYLKYGTTASLTSFTVKISAFGFWEMPSAPRYTGRIDAIWDTATGSARITELTA